MNLFEGQTAKYYVTVWELPDEDEFFEESTIIERKMFSNEEDAKTQAYIFVDKYNYLKEEKGGSYSIDVEFAYGPVALFISRDGEQTIEPENWIR